MPLNSKNIFLLDAFGAFLSSLFALLICFFFRKETGFPQQILLIMILLPSIYFFISIFSHISAGKKWKQLLKLIIVLNLLYCVLNAGFLIFLRHQLTAIGTTYLILEIIVILLIVIVENKLLQNTGATL